MSHFENLSNKICLIENSELPVRDSTNEVPFRKGKKRYGIPQVVSLWFCEEMTHNITRESYMLMGAISAQN